MHFKSALTAACLSLLACGGTNTASDAAALPQLDAPASGARVDVSFDSDVALTGYLTSNASSPPGSPGVLLIHQFQRDDTQWGDWPETLADKGYRVLAFNLRGHGDSDAYGGSLSEILSDASAAPADVAAALAFLASDGQADPSRIAIVGTSIGANLSVGAAVIGSAKAYVSISSRQSAVESLAGQEARGMDSVFYLASAQDSGGVQATDAQSMFELTSGAKDIQIYSGSDHGIAILNNQPEAASRIEDWLAQAL